MSTVCPTFDDLAAYALGKLPRERSEEIDMHLDECTACQGELETCGNADDTFLSRLREPESSEGFLVEAECADLLDRVAAIGREASFVAQRKPDEATAASSSLGDIGPYRLLAKLGAGGMGTVYKAFHTRLERVVALKMLPTDRMRDEQAIARFEREMKAVGKLDHPNIVRATDAGDHDGKHFLVMEYVEGTDLSDLVRQSGPLPIADACEIVRQAAVGLQHAHEHDLVHRDIKPSNLMLNTDSTVKVLDLGLALLPSSGEAGRELTDTGQAMGTLDYMAPEQGGDSHDVDIRADIYSLGATLYKLLTGHVIFGGPQYQTQMQKWKALALQDAPPVQSHRADISDELAAIVHRMIAREKEERFQSPGEVAEVLSAFAAAADLELLLATVVPQTPTIVPQEGSISTTSMRQEASALDTSSHAEPRSVSQSTIDYEVSQQSDPTRRRTLALPVLAVLGLLGVLMLGVFFTLRTPQGTVVVEADPEIAKDLQIVLKQGGKQIEVIDAKGNWTVHLADGHYRVEVRGGDDRLQISPREVTVQRGGKQIVRISLKPHVAPGKIVGPAAGVSPPPGEGVPGAPSLVELDAAVAAGNVIMEIGEWDGIDGEITPDSKHLAIFDEGGGLRIIDFLTHEVVTRIADVQPPLAFSHDGKKMAARFNQKQVVEWDWRTGELLARHDIHSIGLLDMAYLPTGELAVLRSSLIDAKVFERITSKERTPRDFAGHGGSVEQAMMSRTGEVIISRSGNEFRTWDPIAATTVQRISTTLPNPVFRLSPDGKAYYVGGFDRSPFEKRSAITGEVLYSVRINRSGYATVISANGRLGINAGRFLRFFDPETGAVCNSPRGDFTRYFTARGVSLSHNGQYVLIRGTEEHWGTREQQIRLIRLPTCQETTPLVLVPDDADAVQTHFPHGDVGCQLATCLNTASLSADGRLMATAQPLASTATSQGFIGIIDARTGQFVRRFDHPAQFGALLISPSGRFLLKAKKGGGLTMWDSQKGCRWRKENNRLISPSPIFLAAGKLCSDHLVDGYGAEILETETGNVLGKFLSSGQHGKVVCRAASADGLQVVAGTEQGYLYLWRLPPDWQQQLTAENPKPIKPFSAIDAHDGQVRSVAFLPENDRIMSCGDDKQVIEWETASGKKQGSLDLPADPLCLQVDATGRAYTGDVDGVLRLWDIQNWQQVDEFRSHVGPIDELAVTADGTRAVTLSRGDGTTRFWQLPPPGSDVLSLPRFGEERRIVWAEKTQDKSQAAAILPRAELAVTVQKPADDEQGNSIVNLWNIEMETRVRELSGHEGRLCPTGIDGGSLAVSADEQWVAAATDRNVYVWSIADGKLVQTLSSSGPVAFSPDSELLLTGGWKTDCFVWNWKAGEKLAHDVELKNVRQHRLLGSLGLACSFAFDDKGFYIWNWKTGVVKNSFRRHVGGYWYDCRLIAADSGEFVLIGNRDDIELVSATNGITQTRYIGHHSFPAGGHFFGGDRFVVTWGCVGHSDDQTIRFWDAKTGAEIYRNSEHRRGGGYPVFDAAITPDREHLLSVAGDGTIRKFRLPSKAIERLRREPVNSESP